MINPLSIATDGYLKCGTPLTIATRGYINNCGLQPQIIGGGGANKGFIGNEKILDIRNILLREDDEILHIIKMFLKVCH